MPVNSKPKKQQRVNTTWALRLITLTVESAEIDSADTHSSEQCDWSLLQNSFAKYEWKNDELAKMRKNDMFFDDYRPTEFHDASLSLFGSINHRSWRGSAQLISNSIELQTKRETLKQQTSKHVTRPRIGPHKTQAMSIKFVCRHYYAITFHIFSIHSSTIVSLFCVFQIDFIIVWIMVIIANYNLLFKPLGAQSFLLPRQCITTIVYSDAHAFAIQLDINSSIQYDIHNIHVRIVYVLHGRHRSFSLSLCLSFSFGFDFIFFVHSVWNQSWKREKNRFV